MGEIIRGALTLGTIVQGAIIRGAIILGAIIRGAIILWVNCPGDSYRGGQLSERQLSGRQLPGGQLSGREIFLFPLKVSYENKNKCNPGSIGIDINKVVVNESLFPYYKFPWSKCKKLWTEEWIEVVD